MLDGAHRDAAVVPGVPLGRPIPTGGAVGGIVVRPLGAAPPVSAAPTAACESPPPGTVRHTLAASDTLTSLAVRYGSTPEAIARANGMLSMDLDLLPVPTTLVIPLSHEKPLAPLQELSDDASANAARRRQRRLVHDFALAEGCEGDDEARFYLEEADMDVGRARAALREDRAWEATQKGTAMKRRGAPCRR